MNDLDPQRRRRLLQGLVAIGAAWTALAGRRGFAAPAATVIQARPVDGFDEVSWSLSGDFVVEQAERFSLSIEAEAHVLPDIVSTVQQRRLVLDYRPGSRIQTRLPIRVRVGMPLLRRLQLHGSGDVHVGRLGGAPLSLLLAGSSDVDLARLDVPAFDLALTGSGDVAVAGGRVERLQIELSGSGNIDAQRLASRVADVAISGSGNVDVSPLDRLSASIAGSGNIRYRGRPEVAQSVTGAGSVRSVGS